MADQYKKTTNGRYMLNNRLVAAADVPAEVRTSLEEADPGELVDSVGAPIQDDDGDGVEDEPTPGSGNADADEEIDDEDEGTVEDTPEPTPPKPAPAPAKPADEDDDLDMLDEPDPEDIPEDDEEEEDDAPAPARGSGNADRDRQDTGEAFAPYEAEEETPQTVPGMGFPRKNGRTVDVFDGKTPHTHVRHIGGVMVPCTKENYDNKTDEEFRQQLAKLREKARKRRARAARR